MNIDSILSKLEQIKSLKEQIKSMFVDAGLVSEPEFSFENSADFIDTYVQSSGMTGLDKLLTRDFGGFYENSSITILKSCILQGIQSKSRLSFPNVTEAEENCIKGNVVSLSLPKLLKASYSFQGLNFLESLYVPKLQQIGTYFLSYAVLEELYLPSVMTINESAFWLCRNLKKVWLPKTCTSIGAYAFLNCYDSTTGSAPTIYCEATSKPSGWNANWARSSSSSTAITYNVVWGATHAQFERA